jgi:hypothetical protein
MRQRVRRLIVCMHRRVQIKIELDSDGQGITTMAGGQ